MTLENNLYTFGEINESTDTATITIIDGEFSGVQYSYTTIQVANEENEDGTIDLSFEFEIVSKPEGMEHDLENLTGELKEEFGKLLGDVLVDIVTNATFESTGANQSAD